jgi:hypothetical protein
VRRLLKEQSNVNKKKGVGDIEQLVEDSTKNPQ